MQIEHVAIWTNNIERLRLFYETYFQARSGPRYVNPEKGFESFFLEFDSGARLELMCRSDIPDIKDDSRGQCTGLAHVAWSTGSETAVDELTDRLAQDGYGIVDGPRRTGDGYYESVVLDPDGNRIEITA